MLLDIVSMPSDETFRLINRILYLVVYPAVLVILVIRNLIKRRAPWYPIGVKPLKPLGWPLFLAIAVMAIVVLSVLQTKLH
jgi:hypothetical protein